jgi:hypothetical protein
LKNGNAEKLSEIIKSSGSVCALNCVSVECRFSPVVYCLLFSAIALSAFCGLAVKASSVGTAPFIFDDNRVFVELKFVRADGTERQATAFVDLGTPQLTLSETLRRELQVDENKMVAFRMGDLEVKVDSSAVATDSGFGMTGPNGKRVVPVEAVLGGSVMKNYTVVFDYAARTLTFAEPNGLTTSGEAVPCRVNQKTGLISVTAKIAGIDHPLAVDCGSAYTWVRKDIAGQWVKDHPSWKRATGAVGEANMQTRAGGAEARATILRLPEINLGPLGLERIGVVGIASAAPPFPPSPGENKVEGDFFDWYSRKAPERVDGWLGGNVLKGFRITIDFSRAMTYWQPQTKLDPHDLDEVGLTLETRDNEKGYFVAGIAQKDDRPTVEGVRIGDKLIQVDETRLSDATRGAIFSALHGKPGSVRKLILERDGKQVKVQGTITAF